MELGLHQGKTLCFEHLLLLQPLYPALLPRSSELLTWYPPFLYPCGVHYYIMLSLRLLPNKISHLHF